MPDLSRRTKRLIKELEMAARDIELYSTPRRQMPSLREQIETAWKEGSSRTWAFCPNVYGASLSENTIAYGVLWQVTLHYNNCNKDRNLCSGRCYLNTADLVKRRLECIQRGMPDLHPDEEEKIWNIAFRLHERHGGGNITPTWSEVTCRTCNCFEVAKVEYDLTMKGKIAGYQVIPVTPIIVKEEDVWYDEQRLE